MRSQHFVFSGKNKRQELFFTTWSWMMTYGTSHDLHMLGLLCMSTFSQHACAHSMASTGVGSKAHWDLLLSISFQSWGMWQWRNDNNFGVAICSKSWSAGELLSSALRIHTSVFFAQKKWWLQMHNAQRLTAMLVLKIHIISPLFLFAFSGTGLHFLCKVLQLLANRELSLDRGLFTQTYPAGGSGHFRLGCELCCCRSCTC